MTKAEDAFKDGGSSPPRHVLSRARASAMGQLGSRRRWAACSDPAERRAATQAGRDAILAGYLRAARVAPGGSKLDDAGLAERAKQMHLADLAAMRLRRVTK